MYIPTIYREEDLAKLHTLIKEYSFATLITTHDHHPIGTHLPFLLDEACGQYGTLRSHMARQNPQWQDFSNAEEALVIFQGPHAYVSPSWYTSSPNVPTWNYTAVHAYGVPRLVDETALIDILRETVRQSESSFEQPWQLDVPDDYFQRLLRGVVGFEIEITRLEGKFKLNQNKSEADREGVIAGLSAQGDPAGVEVAKMIHKIL
jgi:transcriptional regulator